MRPWYCAQTLPNQEWRVKENLEGRGITTFLPSYLIKKQNRHIALRLLFTNYIFFSIEDPNYWPVVKNTFGVLTVLLQETTLSEYLQPRFVSSSAIEQLRQQSLSYDEIRRGSGRAHTVQQFIMPDVCVRMSTQGAAHPLANLVNEQKPLVTWSDSDRVTLLLYMFGHATKVEFYQRDLEAVT